MQVSTKCAIWKLSCIWVMLHLSPQHFLLLVCWVSPRITKKSVRIRPHRQQREGKSDGWEMNTLSKSKVPQVWTPIIYRQSSNPCQRAVSFWADLSRLSSLPWPGWPAPSTAQCSLSLSCFLTLKLSFSLLSISAGLPTFSSVLLLQPINLQPPISVAVIGFFPPLSKIVYLLISFIS